METDIEKLAALVNKMWLERNTQGLLQGLLLIKATFFAEPPPPPPPPMPMKEVVAVRVEPDNLTIRIGKFGNLIATAFDKDNQAMGGVEFTWQSRDESVIFVNNAGEFKSLAEGSTMVAAYAPNGIHGVARVEVLHFGATPTVKTVSKMKRLDVIKRRNKSVI